MAVACGADSSFAIRSDGTLWSWGANDDGQLGRAGAKGTPAKVAGSGWASVSSGGQVVQSHEVGHTLAVKRDGTLWSWGANADGQLGRAGAGAVPGQVGTDADWKTASAGTNFGVALKTDRSVWSWGSNAAGQLGRSGLALVPALVGQAHTWAGLAAGSAFALGFQNDGSLWAWGWNGSGQLGDGTTANSAEPMPVGSLVH